MTCQEHDSGESTRHDGTELITGSGSFILPCAPYAVGVLAWNLHWPLRVQRLGPVISSQGGRIKNARKRGNWMEGWKDPL